MSNMVKHINNKINKDLNYLKRTNSTQETTNLLTQDIADLVNIWEGKDHKVHETTDKPAKYWTGNIRGHGSEARFVTYLQLDINGKQVEYQSRPARTWITIAKH